MGAVDVVTDALSPVGGWLLAMAALGIGVAVLLFAVRLGWWLVLSFIDEREANAWRRNFDAEVAERDPDYGSEW